MSYGVIPPGSSILDGSARLNRGGGYGVGSNERERLLDASVASVAAATFSVQARPASTDSGRVLPPDAHTPRSSTDGGKHSAFESLDYEEFENTVYRADQASGASVDGLLYTVNKYLICFAIGVVTALAAFAVNLAVENISALKFWTTLTVLEKGNVFASFLSYTCMNATLVVASVLITLYVGPAAAGSGIADVKAYLNGVDVPNIFHFNTLAAKILGAVGSVAGGLAIGKEGPFVHAGAAIAAIISQGGSGAQRLPIMRAFWNDRDRSDMVACGAAAGVAAAFRSPVGGVLFALEEMTSWWRSQSLWLAFFTTAVVSVCIRVLMKACGKHGCGFFGSGGFIYFDMKEGQDNYEFYELLPMLLLGVLGGLLGSGFIVVNARLSEWRKKHLAPLGPRAKVCEAALISVLTSALSFLVPLMVQCQACPPEGTEGIVCPRTDNMHSGNFVNFPCSPSPVPGRQYNDLATLFFNTQDDAIRNLFSSKTKQEYTVSSLLIFSTIFYGLAALTYGITCPTGLFVPSILCGAAYGRLVGIFVADMHPGHHIDEGTYALLGAASFLGGAMRLTVCTCVLLLELTNNLALLPLIMLVLLVAKAVGDGTGVRPIYEVQMQSKGLPFLQPAPEPFMRHLTAKECCGKPPVSLNRVEKVRTLVEVLRGNRHNGFPVMARGPDGEQFMCGIVLRQQVLTLLATGRSLQPSLAASEVSARAALTYSLAEFSKPMSDPVCGPREGVLAPGVLREELMEQYLDLEPFVNPSYCVVQEDTSLSKVYQLLRTLGLRHVAVIPRAPEVVGIITRADLLPDAVLDRMSATPGQYTTDGLNLSAHGGTAGGGGGFGAPPAPRLSGRGKVSSSGTGGSPGGPSPEPLPTSPRSSAPGGGAAADGKGPAGLSRLGLAAAAGPIGAAGASQRYPGNGLRGGEGSAGVQRPSASTSGALGGGSAAQTVVTAAGGRSDAGGGSVSVLDAAGGGGSGAVGGFAGLLSRRGASSSQRGGGSGAAVDPLASPPAARWGWQNAIGASGAVGGGPAGSGGGGPERLGP